MEKGREGRREREPKPRPFVFSPCDPSGALILTQEPVKQDALVFEHTVGLV